MVLVFPGERSRLEDKFVCMRWMGDALNGCAQHIAIAPRKMALHTAGHSWTQCKEIIVHCQKVATPPHRAVIALLQYFRHALQYCRYHPTQWCINTAVQPCSIRVLYHPAHQKVTPPSCTLAVLQYCQLWSRGFNHRNGSARSRIGFSSNVDDDDLQNLFRLFYDDILLGSSKINVWNCDGGGDSFLIVLIWWNPRFGEVWSLMMVLRLPWISKKTFFSCSAIILIGIGRL